MEQQRRSKAPEVIPAVLLAIATVTIAWCAYQSACWGSIQLFRGMEAMGKAREANKVLVNYVFLTVLLASTLSLGGMAGRLQARRARIFLLAVATVIFLTAMALLATYPVAK